MLLRVQEGTPFVGEPLLEIEAPTTWIRGRVALRLADLAHSNRNWPSAFFEATSQRKPQCIAGCACDSR